MQRAPVLSASCGPCPIRWGIRVAEAPRSAPPPLIVHVIHRLDVGGMENGLVNLLNRMPTEAYRHAIICMTDYTDFSQRLQRDDVHLYSLHKREGKDLGVHLGLWRLLRQLRPAIVHTRNLATLEAQVTAAAAGIQVRVHGEHGWDVGDTDGSNPRNRRLRRWVRPLVSQYIALSRHQMGYLEEQIGVAHARLNQVCNGVDTARFRPSPAGADRRAPLPAGFAAADTLTIGAVMRMQPVKAPLELARAFLLLRDSVPAMFPRLRLVLVGDGPLRQTATEILTAAGVAEQVWLPGARDDVPELMRAVDLFVVPSLAEGICNTILEAMATGLPVIATDVGGNPDLVQPGATGNLVPAGKPEALTEAMAGVLSDDAQRQRMGRAARARAEREFSLEAMVQGYLQVYYKALGSAAGAS
ncbi:sugar transferase [Halochromatium glycolicum]|uniref:Sugar transferase n=1 Tax=Halochromatium glycolicum TaxID=85075 RepID=A0AAJ0XBA6_9GAMM|nr:sugar transferase [Halochromatium glycolicum]